MNEINNKIKFLNLPIHIIAIVYSFHEENRNNYKKRISVTKSKNINKQKLLLNLFIQPHSEELNYKYFKKHCVQCIQETRRFPKYIRIKKSAKQTFPNLTVKFINRMDSENFSLFI
jgi:hypothetical protein